MVFGLIFEVPLAITLMAKLGWVDAPFLKRYRKWAFLGSFIFAAILTPTPDPFNQCLMALPMYVFYEVGIVSAGFFNKKKPVPEESGVPAVVAESAGNGKVAGLPNAGEGDYVGVPTGRRR
jgi:sec-independent protein translocase protein TatC